MNIFFKNISILFIAAIIICVSFSTAMADVISIPITVASKIFMISGKSVQIAIDEINNTINNLSDIYYTKTNMQTSGQAALHWDNVTNKPTSLGGATVTVAASGSQYTTIAAAVSYLRTNYNGGIIILNSDVTVSMASDLDIKGIEIRGGSISSSVRPRITHTGVGAFTGSSYIIRGISIYPNDANAVFKVPSGAYVYFYDCHGRSHPSYYGIDCQSVLNYTMIYNGYTFQIKNAGASQIWAFNWTGIKFSNSENLTLFRDASVTVSGVTTYANNLIDAASKTANDSTVTGTTVSDALNTLKTTKADLIYVNATDEAIIASIPEFRTGRAEFNSVTGRAVTFSTPMPDADYQITIMPEDDTIYDIGDWSFKNKTVNGFTIYNSGENTVAYFDYIAIKK